MTTLLVAHGTRNPRGVALIGDLAAAMSARLGQLGYDDEVRVAFVDVLGPTPSEVLRTLPDDEPVTVVPAFLARGYHVRADLPAHLTEAAHSRAVLTPALGPSPLLAEAMVARLTEAGYRRGDAVVLAAAGSSDPAAVADVETAAADLSSLLGVPVTIGFAAPPASGSAYPGVPQAVSAARRRPAQDRPRSSLTGRRGMFRGRPARVAVASFLLADGLFQRRLADSGAEIVAAPLGLHPRVVDLACTRAASPALV